MSNSPQIKKRKQTDPEENLLEINKIYRKINAIIQSNIPHYKNFEITQSDMNVFSYFIRTTPNFINNISCIVTSPHKLIIHEHNERNKLLLKQLILLMTYVFYNKNYIGLDHQSAYSPFHFQANLPYQDNIQALHQLILYTAYQPNVNAPYTHRNK